MNGAQTRNRTTDTGIFSPLLYRLSYLGLMAEVTRLELATSCVTGKHSNQLSYTSINGGRNWARTNDPLLVRQVLSQLSYATTNFYYLISIAYFFQYFNNFLKNFFIKPSVLILPVNFPSIFPKC